MRAMIFEKAGQCLRKVEILVPRLAVGKVFVRVTDWDVCLTDLHLVDGELPQPKLPLIPGHEIVGTVEAKCEGTERFEIGDRVGIPWLGWTCGECSYCLWGRENLCDKARFTGYTMDGGYASYTVAEQRFCFRIPVLYGG